MVDAARAGGLTSRVMSHGYGRELWTTACLVALLSSGEHARAQQPAPAAGPAVGSTASQPELPNTGPSLEATERARAAYARGQQAFAADDFNSAFDAFQEAYDNVQNPIVLLSIAESAAKLGRVEIALAAYDSYLHARPDAPDRDEVAAKRAALAESQMPGQLGLTSEPAGADVILDGQLIGRVTPVTVEVRPGAHHVSLVLNGFETERLDVEVTPAGHLERNAVLHAAPNAVLAQPEPEKKPEEVAPLIAPEPPKAAIIVTTSLGAAGVIAGTVLGIFALKERSDYNNMPTEARADRGERLALFSDVGFGIGAMSLITTAVLLFTHDPPRADDTKDSARFELIPSFTAQSASASAKVRF